eukprot:TRINITY_DN33400_c0_g1_i1.p1 TRINITY_DN33400_c0_g1~~TRINITY_DN33400_c0_g1_i1.p1  ORF type:complete len:335 (+),score=77.49 TRINITY_DN33400_c0_g1_i1:102-1007(+)
MAEEAPGPDGMDRVEAAKRRGGVAFQKGEFEDAICLYNEGLKILDEGGLHAPDAAIRSVLNANMALCCLKLERYEEAEERASAALAADPANSKASYRRGLARLQLSDVLGALEDLQRASRLEPQNREVRQRLEEAQRLVQAQAPAPEEVAVASAATSALGGCSGDSGASRGLYAEKPDLNEGRLADTHREQREWIKTISKWRDIEDISFADEETKISVYMALPGLHDLPINKVCVWMTANSLEIRIIDLAGENWVYVAQELWGQIDPSGSSWKVRKDKLSIKLLKRASARSWDRWEKLRRT